MHIIGIHRSILTAFVVPFVLITLSAQHSFAQNQSRVSGTNIGWDHIRFDNAVKSFVESDISMDSKLVTTENDDVDGDGSVDVVLYFDFDGDGVIDAEAIDLDSPGNPRILALRCDADSNGNYQDWVIIDANAKKIVSALVDTNDDGDVDRIAQVDGSLSPIPGDLGVKQIEAKYYR